ncbi:MAG: GNAT family N-acetyltransferase [Pseudomonadota bacterium]|nr:GNAT family N-acetyltransferase [Pseudomonadota bacterium]
MIRPATLDDLPLLRDCAVQAFSGYRLDMGQDPAPMHADYAALVEAGDVHVVETGDGSFQGFIAYHAEAGAMHLDIVALLPEAAGQGLGRKLIEHCEKAARADGLETVKLYTNVKMQANLTLYPRLGYVETARQSEDGFDRVYFEKRL